MPDNKLKRRRFLADLLFLTGGLSIAALAALRSEQDIAPPPVGKVQVIYPQRSSLSGSLFLP